MFAYLMNIMKVMKIKNLLKKFNASWIWLLYIFAFTLFAFIVLLTQYYDEIPTYKEHVYRNKHNVLPEKKLTLVKDNIYIDDNRIIWMKQYFYQNLFHNPFDNYTFESVNEKKESSSEAVIRKRDFDKGKMKFKNGSFNYYSSYKHPIDHFFADVLPIPMYSIF